MVVARFVIGCWHSVLEGFLCLITICYVLIIEVIFIITKVGMVGQLVMFLHVPCHRFDSKQVHFSCGQGKLFLLIVRGFFMFVGFKINNYLIYLQFIVVFTLQIFDEVLVQETLIPSSYQLVSKTLFPYQLFVINLLHKVTQRLLPLSRSLTKLINTYILKLLKSVR